MSNLITFRLDSLSEDTLKSILKDLTKRTKNGYFKNLADAENFEMVGRELLSRIGHDEHSKFFNDLVKENV